MEHDNRLEPSIFVVKTVAGQEKNAAELVYVKVKKDKLTV